jgi:AcrR family transcriptional regulator
MDHAMTDVKTSRRMKAAATRDAIIRAAHQEFIEQGFHGATVAAIARRGGVAPQTVYFVFHTKPELISAVIDAAVLGDNDPVPPQDQPWWQEMRDASDSAEALRVFVRNAAPIFARAAAISEVLRAAALTDPEVRQTFDAHEALRRAAWSEVLDIVATKGGLRTDRTRGQLLDIFLTTFGDATYHLYAAELGWSADEIVDWMCEALPALLLSPDMDRPPKELGRTR